MGNPRHRRSLLILVLIALAALAVSLVAGLASATAEDTPSPSASAAGAPSVPAEPGKVIYKVGWTGDVDNLNPFIGFTSPSFEVWYLTYDSLIGYDPKTLTPMKGEDSTGLATDWTTSEDGLTWTFTIRQNAKWNDGEPLTASDVAFTYNYIIKNSMENFTAYTNLIEKATAVDDYTVEFKCSKPKPDMIRHWVPILPEHLWSKLSPTDAAKNFQNPPPIVGSGPFTCEEWDKSSYVKMVANPTWWGPKPKIDEIYFMYFTNGDTMVQDIKAGNIDGCVNLVPTQMRLFENEPSIKAKAIAIDGFNELGFNCYKDGPSKGHPALKDPAFRVALNYAVDLDKLVETVWAGYTTPGTTIIPPKYYSDPDWHWEPTADVKYTYDPDIADQKLTEAGYPTNAEGQRLYKGEPIELSLIARVESTMSQQEAKLIAGWFKDIGIKVKIEVMDEAALMDRQYEYSGDTFTPNYDMFLWGWYLDYDPGSMVSYFTKGQIENWSDCAWWDPEYEQLYKQQAEELDPNARKPLLDRMQQILYEQSPYIVTSYAPDFEAINTDKWEGYIYIPDPNGNALLPPFGNGGYANFLSIGPKTGGTADEGSSSTLWIAIVAAVVIVLIVVWLVMRSRKPKAMEE
jgi:peptide/nickel transport system substrate-binding protein